MVTLLRLELRLPGREPGFLPLEDSAMVADLGVEPSLIRLMRPACSHEHQPAIGGSGGNRTLISSVQARNPPVERPTHVQCATPTPPGAMTPISASSARTRFELAPLYSSRCRSIMAGRAGIEPADPALTTQREHLALSRPLMMVRLQNVPREGTFGPGRGIRTHTVPGLSRFPLPLEYARMVASEGVEPSDSSF